MTRLDFVPRGVPLAGWRLAMLAIGVLMLLPAAINWTAQWQTVARLQARLDAQSAALQPQRLTRPALAPAQQQQIELQVKAVAEAVRQLNLPVTRLLKTIEAREDMRIALLGLDLNGEPAPDVEAAAPSTPAGTLKISAEAETAQDMINYLAFLNQQRMFRSVYLLKHEMTGAPPVGGGERPYQFQLEAQWRQ
ncbi:hypothetical protein SAMN05428959_102850 [Duganella sp. CF517]|uniref:hypothetical protein n=1 Tax=Duganella sp. CF517 TaxID=1881038 RepID=UPI0008CEC20C|nr:hypothetical protein [Duganella sp. CF517]SEN67273.1 hypothetical protein SAMN05428959_102850 [Duganella sp. CF517]